MKIRLDEGRKVRSRVRVCVSLPQDVGAWHSPAGTVHSGGGCGVQFTLGGEVRGTFHSGGVRCTVHSGCRVQFTLEGGGGEGYSSLG